MGIILNQLTSGYTQYGAIYKPSALSAIAQTGEDHFDFVDNNMSDNKLAFAHGLYRANPVSELIEGLSSGGGNKGWISIAGHNTTASQSDIDEVKIDTLSGSDYIQTGTEILSALGSLKTDTNEVSGLNGFTNTPAVTKRWIASACIISANAPA